MSETERIREENEILKIALRAATSELMCYECSHDCVPDYYFEDAYRKQVEWAKKAYETEKSRPTEAGKQEEI